MMKRLITLWLAVLLMLCGCGTQKWSPDTATDSPATTPPQVTEPAGMGDADSLPECSVDSVLQVYSLAQSGSTGIVPMGTDLLIFSGTDATVLTKYSGDKLSL